MVFVAMGQTVSYRRGCLYIYMYVHAPNADDSSRYVSHWWKSHPITQPLEYPYVMLSPESHSLLCFVKRETALLTWNERTVKQAGHVSCAG